MTEFSFTNLTSLICSFLTFNPQSKWVKYEGILASFAQSSGIYSNLLKSCKVECWFQVCRIILLGSLMVLQSSYWNA